MFLNGIQINVINFQNSTLCNDFDRWKRFYYRWLHWYHWWFATGNIHDCRVQRWKLEICWGLGRRSSISWCDHLRIYSNGCWWWVQLWRNNVWVSVYLNHRLSFIVWSIENEISFNKLFLRTNTELWDLNSFESEIINPVLSYYYSRPGLFLVDVGYCSKTDKEEWNCWKSWRYCRKIVSL